MTDEAPSRRDVVRWLGALGAGALATETVVAETGREPTEGRTERVIGVADDHDFGRVRQEVVTGIRESASRTASVGEVKRNENLGFFVVELPEAADGAAMQALERRVAAHGGVDYHHPNFVDEKVTMEAPNDPDFDDQYAPQLVNAPAAWDETFGSDDVTIGVVDTGANYGHEDLSSRYPSDPGQDFVDDDGDPYPDGGRGHGTHVSGCASADTDNGIGVAGPTDSTLLNARVLGSGSVEISGIAEGIEWMADAGADVINMSLGNLDYGSIQSAVEYADDQGALQIVAAGNNGSYGVSYPAGWDECVAVSAIDPNEDLASFSQYGPDVEVCAPGVNVLSTTVDGGYGAKSGTSMAAPVASGVAALGLAADSSLTASELRQRLKDTAADIGLSANEQGSGRVDAEAIVDAGLDGGDGGDDGDDGDDGDGGDGGQCDQVATDSVTSSLGSSWDSESWEWSREFANTCSLEVTLDGPSDADFDLYLGRGYTPTTSNYDQRSISWGSQESLTLEDVSQTVGVLVDSYSGSGQYTLSFEETGND